MQLAKASWTKKNVQELQNRERSFPIINNQGERYLYRQSRILECRQPNTFKKIRQPNPLQLSWLSHRAA